MEEETKKWYCLYADKEQSKLHACASTLEGVKEMTEYYSSGVWFEYDDVNNVLLNEKIKTGIKFPKEPKPKENAISDKPKASFKWVQ